MALSSIFFRGLSARAIRALQRILPVPAQTLRRWLLWWSASFPSTPTGLQVFSTVTVQAGETPGVMWAIRQHFRQRMPDDPMAAAYARVLHLIRSLSSTTALPIS